MQMIFLLRVLCLLLTAALVRAQTLTWIQIPEETLKGRLSAVRAKNDDRAARLEKMFEEAGCTTDHLKREPVNKKWDNIVCTLPGSTDEAIVVGAHYDHTEKGDGAVDNWSGSSLLPSLYQTLAASKRRFTYVFAGFAEEEKGLLRCSCLRQGVGERTSCEYKGHD